MYRFALIVWPLPIILWNSKSECCPGSTVILFVEFDAVAVVLARAILNPSGQSAATEARIVREVIGQDSDPN